MRQKRSFFATLLLAFMIIWLILPVFAAALGEDFMKDIWSDVAEAIPFGNTFGEWAIQIFTQVTQIPVSVSEYRTPYAAAKSAAVLMQEFGKLCLTAVIYEAVGNFGDVCMGIKEKGGIWAVAQKVLWHMICAFLCAGLCSIVLQFAYAQINSMVPSWSRIWSGIITGIVLLGSVGVFFFILQSSIIVALVYVFVKIVFVNVVKLCVTYIFLLFTILCISEQAYMKLFTGSCMWLLIIIILIGIDLMIGSVIKK